MCVVSGEMSTGVLCPFWRMLGVNPAARERRLAVCLPRTSWFRQPALAVSQVLFISAVGHAAGALRAAGLSLCWGLCASCVHGQAAGLGTGECGGLAPPCTPPAPAVLFPGRRARACPRSQDRLSRAGDGGRGAPGSEGRSASPRHRLPALKSLSCQLLEKVLVNRTKGRWTH